MMSEQKVPRLLTLTSYSPRVRAIYYTPLSTHLHLRVNNIILAIASNVFSDEDNLVAIPTLQLKLTFK